MQSATDVEAPLAAAFAQVASDGAYDVDLYEQVHRGCPGDEAFYLRHCAGAHSVIELGCGWGRLLGVVASSVPFVAGVDVDARQLDRARERRDLLPSRERSRVVLLEGDMSALTLGCRFERVLVPFGGLQCLLDEATQLAALRAARALMGAHGRLVFDTYSADAMHDEERCECVRVEDAPWDGPDPVVVVETGGASYRVFESSRWCRRQQRIDVVYEHRPEYGPSRFGVIRQRYLLASDVERLCERAGFVIDDWHGDFDGAPPSRDAERHVVVARAR